MIDGNNNNNIIIIIGFSTVGQENRYKRETGDETVDRLHHLVVQLESGAAGEWCSWRISWHNHR